MKTTIRFVAACLAGAAMVSCAQQQQQESMESNASGQAQSMSAVAAITPASGSDVRGIVTFTAEEGGGVRIVADLSGLPPGEHGFHVHENGDCSAPDGSSAGGHFNPMEMPHGGPDAMERHVGDLGNITAGEDGNAHYERVDTHLSLEGDQSIVGRAVIVHEKVDDYATQPTGNAGARLGCGVIAMQL